MRILWSAMLVMMLVGCDEKSLQGAANGAQPPAGETEEPVSLDSLPAPARSTELLRRAEEAGAAEAWTEAARLYSRVWEHEFPVDAFFDTVEISRIQVMETAASDQAVSELVYMYAMAEVVRRLTACPEPFPEDLPGEVMVHWILTSKENAEPERELAAADPWRIAAELWAVRHGHSNLKPDLAAERAVARYLSRPDLWTAAATNQLWLLAAESDLVEASSGWPAEIRPAWRRAPSDGGLLTVEVRQWGGGMLRTLPGMTGMLIDGQPAVPGWGGKPEPRKMKPGRHEIRFLDMQLHSRTVPVEVEPGTCQAVMLIAIAGV